MKTTLDHLPPGKQQELAFVVETLREGFRQALSRRTMPRFRSGKLLKIILFGSYARGDWVEDPKGRYFSDYDLLVVVNHEDLTELSEFWTVPDETFLKEYASGERYKESEVEAWKASRGHKSRVELTAEMIVEEALSAPPPECPAPEKEVIPVRPSPPTSRPQGAPPQRRPKTRTQKPPSPQLSLDL